MPSFSSSLGIVSAFITAAITAAAFVFAAAGIGWLIHSPVVAAALAMIVSSLMIFGFGDLPSWAKIVVGLLWWFSDLLSARGLAPRTLWIRESSGQTPGLNYLLCNLYLLQDGCRYSRKQIGRCCI